MGAALSVSADTGPRTVWSCCSFQSCFQCTVGDAPGCCRQLEGGALQPEVATQPTGGCIHCGHRVKPAATCEHGKVASLSIPGLRRFLIPQGRGTITPPPALFCKCEGCYDCGAGAAFFLPSEGRSRADEGRAAAHPGVDQLVGNGTTNSILGIRTLLGPAALPVETCLTRHQPCTLLAAHTLLAAL